MKKHYGFTMIEVALFLALTGAIFIGIAVGMSNSISQQRYNDSVQNFADFLRNVYSEVENVQGAGDGRSEQAIYGKLVTFGESLNTALENNSNKSIFVYDVVGKLNGSISSASVIASLKNLDANVVLKSNGIWTPAGLVESYKPNWSAKIEQINSHDDFVGAILIVRSPSSGTIYTYNMTGETVEVNETLKTAGLYPSTDYNPLATFLNDSSYFRLSQVDFCISPEGDPNYSGLRRDIRIVENSHNSSGVIITTDEESACRSL